MNNCPNCGHPISSEETICPNCGIDLTQFRNVKPKTPSRAAYREEFRPKKQNSVVQKMIAWIRANATIVYLLGVFLLIVMSFSRSLGWILFLVLMIWLFIVCDRAEKIEQYTSDRRLTEKINQIGSDTFNSIDDHRAKIRTRSEKFTANHPKVNNQVQAAKKRHRTKFTYIQLSVVLTALISLIVLFSGSGASVVNDLYDQKMSISKVLLTFGNRLLASQQTVGYAALVYLIWILLIIFPILIIYHIFKNTRKSQAVAFILSLIETVFIIYIIFKMTSTSRANTGMFSELTSQLLTYAVSVGASTYFLIISSTMTTVLSGYNLFRKKKNNLE